MNTESKIRISKPERLRWKPDIGELVIHYLPEYKSDYRNSISEACKITHNYAIVVGYEPCDDNYSQYRIKVLSAGKVVAVQRWLIGRLSEIEEIKEIAYQDKILLKSG